MFFRTIVSGISISLFLFCCLVNQCEAHTRERKRIDELEARTQKEKAVLIQRLSVMEQTQSSNAQAIDERREHSARIEKRMALVEENVEKGLRAIRDTIGKQLDVQIKSLKDKSQAQAQQIVTLSKSLESHRESIKAINEALEGFKKYMAQSSKETTAQFKAVNSSIATSQRTEQKHYQQLVSRIDSLLKIVDEENRKLRKAIAGSSAPTEAGVHIVVSGDNLWSIARQYNVSRDDILKHNPSLHGDSAVIHPGMKIVIP